MSTSELSREFIAERDYRIWQMRAAGHSHTEIAKRFDMTVRGVAASISRQARKLNREAAYSYPEVMRLELEALDTLQKNIWPLAQHRKTKLEDGTEVVHSPDLDAIDRILKIQERRAKLLGMDVNRFSIETPDIRHAMHGAKSGEHHEIDMRSETIAMLELMADARIIGREVVEQAQKGLPQEVIDVDASED